MALLDILKKKKGKKYVAEKSADVVPASDEKQKTRKTKDAPQRPPRAESGKKGERFSHIIIRPRITEKAGVQSGGNSYTFEVALHANKIQIKKAIKEIYNVEPVRVNIVVVKPKRKIVRNRWGKTASFKKAIVFLKEGDTIEFV